MPKAHRNNDGRICGATTIVSGQSTVFVNGKLWAVEADPNTHGGGGLIASGDTVFIENKKIIVNAPDSANPDSLCIPLGPPHCNPQTSSGSENVFAY